MGVQIDKGEQQQCLDELDFTYQEETENPAYRLFSGGIR
jgi:threonine dehydratase